MYKYNNQTVSMTSEEKSCCCEDNLNPYLGAGTPIIGDELPSFNRAFKITDDGKVIVKCYAVHEVWNNHYDECILDYFDLKIDQSKICDFCGTKGDMIELPVFMLGDESYRSHKMEMLDFCSTCTKYYFTKMNQDEIKGSNMTVSQVHCKKVFYIPYAITATLTNDQMQQFFE